MDNLRRFKPENQSEQELYQRVTEYVKLLQESAKQQLGNQSEKLIQFIDTKKLGDRPSLFRLEFILNITGQKCYGWFVFVRDQSTQSFRIYELVSRTQLSDQPTFLGTFGKDKIGVWDLFSENFSKEFEEGVVEKYRLLEQVTPQDFEDFVDGGNFTNARLVEVNIGKTKKEKKDSRAHSGFGQRLRPAESF